jgi:hypothetical protein
MDDRWRLQWLAALSLMLAAGCGWPIRSTDADRRANELTEVAEVACARDGSTRLLTREVAARPDGVHVLVRNRTGEPISMNGLGLDFDEATSEQVSEVAPGEVGIACWPYSQHRDEEPKRIPLHVEDPNDYWVSPELECDSSLVGSTINDFIMDSAGEEGKPVDLARKHLEGLRATDVVELAGYPESPTPLVRVVRGPDTVATVSFIAAKSSGWLLAGSDICSQSGIRVRP